MNARNHVVIAWASACLTLTTSAVIAADTGWRGFRGMEAHARSDVPIRAIDWTANRATQWTTPIPGEGVSSPVLTADRIYLTTSWETSASDQVQRVLALVVLLFAVSAAIVAVTRTEDRRRVWIGACALGVVGVCAVLWWPGIGDLLRTPRRAAMVGAAQMSALGTAAFALIAPVGRMRTLFLLALAVPLIWSASQLQLQPQFSPGAAEVFVLLQGLLTAAVLYALRTPTVILAKQHKIAGWSSLLLMPVPMIAAGAVTTEQMVTRAVVALDRQSGAQLWMTEVATEPRGTYHVYNSSATPTPVITSDAMYAYFGSAGLVALGLDGKVRWKNTSLFFDSVFGVGTSPVEYEGVVLLSSGGTDRPYVSAVDATTGAELWRRNLPKSRNVDGNNRTPLILNWQGQPCVLVWELEVFTCFSVRSGEEQFQYRLTVPLRIGAFTASATLHDGDVYLGEENGAVRLDFEVLPDGRDPVMWFSKGPGTECASPAVANGLLFLVSEGGIASARDIETGEVVWNELLDGSEYFASPVTDGRIVLFCSRDGHCTFVRADRQFEVIARNEVPPGLMATPAIQDGVLYVRVPGQLRAFF